MKAYFQKQQQAQQLRSALSSSGANVISRTGTTTGSGGIASRYGNSQSRNGLRSSGGLSGYSSPLLTTSRTNMSSKQNQSLPDNAEENDEGDDASEYNLSNFHEQSIESRVNHCKNLQYVQHQQLFAVSYTSLHKAAKENSLVGVKFFLTRGNKEYTPVSTLDKHGYAAIHHAAERGSNDVIEYFVNTMRCDVNLVTSYDNTPLMLACKENQNETVSLLLELGANIMYLNKSGLNCFHFAAQADHAMPIITIAKAFRFTAKKSRAYARRATPQTPSKPNISPLEAGADANNTESNSVSVVEEPIITRVLDERHPHYHLMIAFAQPAKNLVTPLHMAALNNAINASKVLLEYGANPNAKDQMGDTPLHKAARNGFHELFRLLIAFGANDLLENNFRERASDILRDIIG